MIVKENIDFKRGKDPKETLELGFQGLPSMFDELFKLDGLEKIAFESYGKSPYIDYITFFLEDAIPNIEFLMIDEIKESGLSKFLDEYSIEKSESFKKIYLDYNIKKKYRPLFKRYILAYGQKFSNASLENDSLFPA